jgi:DNA-binding NtrC family response regulator
MQDRQHPSHLCQNVAPPHDIQSNTHIWILDDNRELRFTARLLLEDHHYVITELEHPSYAKALLQQQQPALILLDMNFQLDTTSGAEGLAFLQYMKESYPDIAVVAMTAWSNTPLVVHAMQAGAADFIEKPWQNQRFLQIIQQQLKVAALNQQNQRLNAQLKAQQHTAENMPWRSASMRQFMQHLHTVAQTDATILLTGENGTGKSQLAQWLHQHSRRQHGPFISVNMAAIPEALFESELFGHKKGAFTDAKESRVGRFTLAEGGTLFFDEIACLPWALQAKLLRVLETGEYEMVGSSQTLRSNLRLISASNANFATLIAQGLFRQDLYYRLNTMEFRIPPLRERIEDIEPLCCLFLAKHGQRYQKTAMQLSPEALRLLQKYHWPGNIRELSHLLERAVLLCQSHRITSADLGLDRSHHTTAACLSTEHAQRFDRGQYSPQEPLRDFPHNYPRDSSHGNAATIAAHTSNAFPSELPAQSMPDLTLAQAELQLIQRALSQHRNNKQKAAEQLGITKSSLYRRLEKYGLV